MKLKALVIVLCIFGIFSYSKNVLNSLTEYVTCDESEPEDPDTSTVSQISLLNSSYHLRDSDPAKALELLELATMYGGDEPLNQLGEFYLVNENI